MKPFNSLFTIIILLSATTSPVLADILILKTSDHVTGSFDGGNALVVRFRTAYGDVKEYDILSVQQIQFIDEQRTTVLPTTSASQLNAANTGFTLPTGSKITIRMIDGISNEKQTAGSLFLANVEESMRVDSVEVIPIGADVWGCVTGSARLGLELTEIFANGIPFSLATAECSSARDCGAGEIVKSDKFEIERFLNFQSEI